MEERACIAVGAGKTLTSTETRLLLPRLDDTPGLSLHREGERLPLGHTLHTQ